ncbi:MAG: hypothetical protein ABR953_13175, partial [Candidatus Acidiferrales bacterium]
TKLPQAAPHSRKANMNEEDMQGPPSACRSIQSRDQLSQLEPVLRDCRHLEDEPDSESQPLE